MLKKILIGLALLACLSTAYKVSDFEGSPFSVKPAAGLYELNEMVFDDQKEGNRVVAYGDYNNDKMTDIVTISDDGKTLYVLLWKHDDAQFNQFATLKFDSQVEGVIPGDFNFDGLLDLLVISSDGSRSKAYLELFLRNEAEPYFGQTDSVPDLFDSLTPYQQPLIFDADGDRQPELLAVNGTTRKSISLVKEGSIYYWQEQEFSEWVNDSFEGCLDSSTAVSQQFRNIHSSSFVDLNGDCAADLFIESKDSSNNLFWEIWLRNSQNNTFCLVSFDKISLDVSLVSFGDMNKNGRIDMVYLDTPSDSSKPVNLHIIKNILGTDTSAPCGYKSALASPYDPKIWDKVDQDDEFAKVFPVTTKDISNLRLFNVQNDYFPGRLRIGDLNVDGYPDVMFTGFSADESNPTTGTLILLVNNGGNVYYGSGSEDFSKFYSISNGQDLIKYKILYSSFFDFDETGSLGLWMVTQQEGEPTKLVGVFNFVSTQNFFLKSNILNGFFTESSDDIKTSLGGIYHGPSMECLYTTVDGQKQILKGFQLPQSAFSPLDLMYIYVGLGRTNNYIEDFTIGIPALYDNEPYRTSSWTPIIPNSQLIVNPLWRETWTLDVYVSPTSATPLIILTTVAILVILGVIILYYHHKEKEEDKAAQDKILHIFG